MPLTILPGASLVLFVLNLGTGLAIHSVAPSEFLEGLSAANNALSFASVHSEDLNLDELLPWCGNV